MRPEWLKSSVEKLSEKGWRILRCSLTEHRNGTFGPILASLRLSNPRSECCSYPFSDSFRRGILGSSRRGGSRKYVRWWSTHPSVEPLLPPPRPVAPRRRDDPW